MRWSIGVPAAAIAAVAWIGCSDGDNPAGPTPEEPSELILSDPLGHAQGSAASGGEVSVTFVSLPPGTFPDAETVIIRNLTAGDGAELTVAVADGGFDPVALLAEVGDRLEFEFRGPAGVISRKYGTVPRRKPPVIVRTAPPDGRTDVALGVRPTIIFSEPVDPATLAQAVMLRQGGNQVEGQVAPNPTETWVVEFIPAALFTPLTHYVLEIGSAVRDSDGDGLESAVSVSFSTGAGPSEPPAPPPTGLERIAFVSTRNGGPWIYLANTDGSGVVPLVNGESPAWSWDGTRIAFHRGLEVLVINADGSGESRVAANARFPAWAPGDSVIAFQDDPLARLRAGIGVVNSDGSARRVLIPGLNLNPSSVGCCDRLTTPAWAPDGRSLAFVRDSFDYMDDQYGYTQRIRLYLADADGSNVRARPFTISGDERRFINPSWSPDGSELAFETRGLLGGADAWDWVLATLEIAAEAEPHPRDQRNVPYRSLDPAGGADWSPDGRRLAFTAEYWAPRLYDRGPSLRLYALDLDTGIAQQLIPNATGQRVNWDYHDSQVAWSRVRD